MEAARKWKNRLALACLALAALAQAGCLVVAAGAAAAGAGYIYYKGEVPQTFAASIDDTRSAARAALTELGMPITAEEKESAGRFVLKSKLANGDVVRVNVEAEPGKFPAEGPVTRVGVRIATLGDYSASDRLLAQIGAHLVPQTPAPGAPPSGINLMAPQSPAAGLPGTIVPVSATKITPPKPPDLPPSTSEPPRADGSGKAGG